MMNAKFATIFAVLALLGVCAAPVASRAATIEIGLSLTRYPAVQHLTAGDAAGVRSPRIVVHVGDSIVFVNQEADGHHTATRLDPTSAGTFPSNPKWSDAALQQDGSSLSDAAWSTGDLAPGAASRPLRATRPGIYYYGCFFDYAAGMRGQIVVEP